MIFSGIAAGIGFLVEGATAIGAGLFGAEAAGAGAAAAGIGSDAVAGGLAAGAGVSASSISAGVGLAGLGLQGYSALGQMRSQKEAAAISQKQEDVRERQAQVAALRERREIARRAISQRAVALSNATAGGASESSGYAGGVAQITSEEGRLTGAVTQNLDLGEQMFGLNKQLASVKGDIATYQGLGEFGKAGVTSSDAIGRIGATLFGGTSKSSDPYRM